MFILKPLKLIFLASLFGLLTACGEGKQQAATTSAEKPAAQTYNWKMVTTWPPNFPIFQEGVERFSPDLRCIGKGQLIQRTLAAMPSTPWME